MIKEFLIVVFLLIIGRDIGVTHLIYVLKKGDKNNTIKVSYTSVLLELVVFILLIIIVEVII